MVSHRSPRRHAQRGPSWPARFAVLSAAAGAAAALGPAVPAGAQPGDDAEPPGRPSVASVASRVDRLYERAESATQQYDAAAERVGELRGRVERVQDRAARDQDRVNRLRDALGAVAGAQYRSGGLDPSVALLLTEDPEGYLAKAGTLDRIGERTSGRLARLRGAQRALAQQRSEAGELLDRLRHEQAELRRQKQAVRAKLAAARRLLGALTPRQRADHERASRDAGRVPGTALAHGSAPASSARAAAALAAARSALGRPYVWGASGPAAFDCSGLTQWAYARAGAAIPRTSQAQRAAGRHVPLAQARPGDLVIYRADASHVAMYAGAGQVVHAPHPGAQVRYDPVGMMPVSAVVRP